ncbi:dnaJ homolog subfamily C member 2-like [Aplochiton taeniatus]
MILEALEGDVTIVCNAISVSVQIQVEPVGRWFEAFLMRRNRNVSASFQELEEEEELSEESEDEELQMEEYSLLRTLDPKDWKNQDHYAVLGLAHIRYKATQKQIKAAHKAMVLKHHPDKRKAAGEQIVEGDNDYFTCITKAIEILSDPVKRRAFDSVDPTFENAVPSKAEGKDNFFAAFSPVFERNARWSTKKHAPKLGTMDSTFEEVDNFYSFWYNLDSWREFSYLDEEEKEKAECRDERRWIEKQNRASRAQRKKEEMNRIRTLVDTAYGCDPRIKKFKEEEKARKESEKKAKADAKRKEQDEKERALQLQLETARLTKEKEEEKAKQAAQQAKKEKEIQKKATKKERQKLRTTCKNWNYFSDNEAESVKMMEEVEKLCDRLELVSLQTLNEELNTASKEDGKLAVEKQVQEVNAQLQMEKEAEVQARLASRNTEQASGGGGSGGKGWNEEELQLLIKAVNLFPAGTNARWEVIANYMTLHSTSGIKRTAKDVINKAKNLQRLGERNVVPVVCLYPVPVPIPKAQQDLSISLNIKDPLANVEKIISLSHYCVAFEIMNEAVREEKVRKEQRIEGGDLDYAAEYGRTNPVGTCSRSQVGRTISTHTQSDSCLKLKGSGLGHPWLTTHNPHIDWVSGDTFLASALERLQNATIFTKLDLRNAYNLVCTGEGDEWEMVSLLQATMNPDVPFLIEVDTSDVGVDAGSPRIVKDIPAPYFLDVTRLWKGITASRTAGYKLVILDSVRPEVLQWEHSSPLTRSPRWYADLGVSGVNRQTERLNQDLETTLRCFAAAKPTLWSDNLLWPEYAHNTLKNASTAMSPFECQLGYQRLFPEQGTTTGVPSALLFICRA